MELPGEVAAGLGATLRADAAAGRVVARPVQFDTWVDQAGPDLMRFAQATARGLDPADLVQDALVAVFTRWSRLTEPGHADAYARKVILHSHVSRWRKWGKRVSVGDPPTATQRGRGPEAAVDDVLAMKQLLATLSVDHRAAVFLRFYDDLTYAQIAGVIGCREATARSYVHRALTQLKNQIAKDTPHD